MLAIGFIIVYDDPMARQLNNLSQEEILQNREYFQRLYDGLKISVEHNGCHLWHAATSHGYPRCPMARSNGSSSQIGGHQLSYFLFRGEHILKGYHISHLCHVSLCVNPEHLSQEPPSINMKRNTCKKLTNCCGHPGYRDCIFN